MLTPPEQKMVMTQARRILLNTLMFTFGGINLNFNREEADLHRLNPAAKGAAVHPTPGNARPNQGHHLKHYVNILRSRQKESDMIDFLWAEKVTWHWVVDVGMPTRVQSMRTKFDEMTTTKPNDGVIGVIFDPIIVITRSPNMIRPI